MDRTTRKGQKGGEPVRFYTPSIKNRLENIANKTRKGTENIIPKTKKVFEKIGKQTRKVIKNAKKHAEERIIRGL